MSNPTPDPFVLIATTLRCQPVHHRAAYLDMHAEQIEEADWSDLRTSGVTEAILHVATTASNGEGPVSAFSLTQST